MKSIVAALSLLLFSLVVPLIANEGPNWHPYNRENDKEVTLQGVAWGLHAKGLGIRVMTPDGMPVYFDPKDVETGKDFEQWQGRLIEVTGILRKRKMEAAPRRAQGYGSAFEYLVVERAKIRGIDKVEQSLASREKQGGGGQPDTRSESK
jgi:hypothetical protein